MITGADSPKLVTGNQKIVSSDALLPPIALNLSPETRKKQIPMSLHPRPANAQTSLKFIKSSSRPFFPFLPPLAVYYSQIHF
jgi:hypothetical protein